MRWVSTNHIPSCRRVAVPWPNPEKRPWHEVLVALFSQPWHMRTDSQSSDCRLIVSPTVYRHCNHLIPEFAEGTSEWKFSVLVGCDPTLFLRVDSLALQTPDYLTHPTHRPLYKFSKCRFTHGHALPCSYTPPAPSQREASVARQEPTVPRRSITMMQRLTHLLL